MSDLRITRAQLETLRGLILEMTSDSAIFRDDAAEHATWILDQVESANAPSQPPAELEVPADAPSGLDLEAIRARAEVATAGPWKVWAMQVLADPVGNSNLDDGLGIAETYDPHRGLRTFNAEFIAHARTDVPALLAEVERLRAEVAWLDDMTVNGDLIRALIKSSPARPQPANAAGDAGERLPEPDQAAQAQVHSTTDESGLASAFRTQGDDAREGQS